MKKIFIILVGVAFSSIAQSEADPNFLCTNKRLFDAGQSVKPSENIEVYASCKKNDLILVNTRLLGVLCDMKQPIIQLDATEFTKQNAYCYYRGSPREVRSDQEDQIGAKELERKRVEADRSRKELADILSSNKG